MAKQMIYTGYQINAKEALRIGLVNRIYSQTEILNKAKIWQKKFIIIVLKLFN